MQKMMIVSVNVSLHIEFIRGIKKYLCNKYNMAVILLFLALLIIFLSLSQTNTQALKENFNFCSKTKNCNCICNKFPWGMCLGITPAGCSCVWDEKKALCVKRA